MQSAEKTPIYTCKELCKIDKFEEIFDSYSKKLYRYLFLHLSSKEEAEDMLSATFTRFWEYVTKEQNRKREVKNISAFLYRIARNLVIDQYRMRKPAISVDEMLESGLELPELKALDIDKKAEFSLVVSALEAIELNDRDLLLLRFVEDMAVRDIAELYDITENNASVRIHRALLKLREFVNRDTILRDRA